MVKCHSKENRKLIISLSVSSLLIGGIVAGLVVWKKNEKASSGLSETNSRTYKN